MNNHSTTCKAFRWIRTGQYQGIIFYTTEVADDGSLQTGISNNFWYCPAGLLLYVQEDNPATIPKGFSFPLQAIVVP